MTQEGTVIIEDWPDRSCSNCRIRKELNAVHAKGGLKAALESPRSRECVLCTRSMGAAIARALGAGKELKDNWVPIEEGRSNEADIPDL
jgi:hypothetical protein